MRKITFLLSTLLFSSLLLAQEREVTLVVNGDGANQTEAETNALRSAIEQAFGAFVSANTAILNDELVKDEIVTISSGNIKSYEVISSTRLSDDIVNVSLKAIVSINSLISYAQSHGSAAEFAGQTFLHTIKLRELNKKNEYLAIQHLRDQVMRMANTAFDYEIIVKEPKVRENGNDYLQRSDWDKYPKAKENDNGSIYIIPIVVRCVPNNNFYTIENLINNTIQSLALSKDDAAS